MPRNESLHTVLVRTSQLSLRDVLEVILPLAARVAALHVQSGRIHGAIIPQNVVFDESGRVELSQPEATVRLGDGASIRELCPPELQDRAVECLPTTIPAAQTWLRAAGLTMDPRRVDVYQLGALLCRLVTGQSVQSYLHSPQTAAKVPAPLRPLLDRALGYDRHDCLASAEDFIRAAHEASAPDPDLPFTTLGHFQIVARLGQGGMGDVYKGYELALDRTVAIKVLAPELARLDDFVRRFHAEAAAVARLTHPNVVQIHFIGEDQGRHFFAMQYVEGESLAELLSRQGSLGLDETLAVVQQTLAGLAAAHKQGIVHRDIKPANILLDRENHRALVADFGLVKSVAAGTKMTATGIVMGSVDYISPEQGCGQPVDARSDLYSVGVLMYQVLSGRLPFEADSPTAMIFQHVYEQPQPLGDLASQVPDALCTIVHRLLAKSPADRHQSAEEVLADLRAFRTGQPLSLASGTATPARPVRPKPEMIRAPAFAEDPDSAATPLLFGEPSHERGVSRGLPKGDQLRSRIGRVRGWLLGLLRDRAPEIVQRLQNTQQQVDGAVAEYERRQRSLQELVQEAEEVLEELKRQAKAQRRAAVAARRRADAASGDDEVQQALAESTACQHASDQLTAQIREQERELETMHLRLAQVNATLQQIQSQRDALNARLKMARARIQLADGTPSRARAVTPVAIRIGILVAAVTLIVGAALVFRPGQPEATSFAVSSPSDATQPSTRPHEPGEFTTPDKPPGQVDDWDTVTMPKAESPRRAEPVPDQRSSSSADTALSDSENVVRKFADLGWNVTSLAFSPDGRHLAVGKLDAAVLLFEIASGRRLAQTGLRDLGQVTALRFTPDGRRLFLGGSTGAIQAWDLGSGGVLESAGLSGASTAHQSAVRCLALTGDSDCLISGSNDKRLVWQQPGAATGARTLASLERAVLAVHVTSGGAAVMASDGGEWVWVDLRTFEVTRRVPLLRSPAQAVSISSDGALLACSYGYEIKIWDTDGGQIRSFGPGRSEIQWSVLFTPDARRLLSGGQGKLYVWDLAADRPLVDTPIASFSLGGVLYVQTLAVSPDGTLAAAVPSAAGQTLYVFRLPP